MGKGQLRLAKISRPEIRDCYLRKRLFRLLDRGRKFPVTWISAPAGSGKTTFVSSYIQEKKLPCIWYQIDPGDEDIASFFHYMGVAGKKASPRRRRPLPHLSPEYIPGLPVFSRKYFRELFDRMKDQSILVFDNYQEVSGKSLLHSVVQNGFEEITGGIHIIVISREDPPPVLARLRIKDAINVIGWNDLRLDPQEIRGICRLRTKKSISEETMQSLYQKTRGWVAGLVLMTEKSGESAIPETMKDRTDRTPFFDFFTNEVFQYADETSKKFLISTSLLPPFSIEIAEKLTGSGKAAWIMTDLLKRNFFTVKRAGAPPTYEYHPLFKEFLNIKFRELLSLKEREALQKRAAELLEQAGQIEDAAALYQNTGDWLRLSALIMSNARFLASQGRYVMLGNWLSSVPETEREENPWLLYWLGVCRMPFCPSESELLFSHALDLFRKGGDAAGVFLAFSGIVESICYSFDDFTKFDKWIDMLDELMAEYPAFPSVEIECRVSYSMLLAVLFRRPNYNGVHTWGERAFRLAQELGDLTLMTQTGFHLAYAYTHHGKLSMALPIIKTLQALSPDAELPPLVTAVKKTIEAYYHFMTASLKPCIEAVSEGLDISRTSGVQVMDYMLMGQRVSGCLVSGDTEGARKFLAEMSSVLKRGTNFDISFYHFLSVWEAMVSSNISEAFRHLKRVDELSRGLGAQAQIEWGNLATAFLYQRTGERKKAGSLIREVKHYSQKTGNSTLECPCLFFEALTAFEQGSAKSEKHGLKALQRAIEIGRKNGFSAFLAWQPDIMTGLYAKALEHGIEPEYVKETIRKCNLVPEQLPFHIEDWPWNVKIYTLGRFEIEKHGKTLSFSGKVQKKPLEMLRVLIAAGGKEVREYKITDTLWPESDGDAAHSAFTTNLQRLRKLLGDEKTILFQDGRVTLNDRYCWVDTWAFDRLMDTIENMPDKTKPEKIAALIDRALGMYDGAFLVDEEEHVWMFRMRERLRNRLLHNISNTAQHLCKAKYCEQVLHYYQKGLEVENLAEDFYRGQMKCYHCLGRNAKGVVVYERCGKTFLSVLGIEPSPQTKAVYKSLLDGL